MPQSSNTLHRKEITKCIMVRANICYTMEKSASLIMLMKNLNRRKHLLYC